MKRAVVSVAVALFAFAAAQTAQAATWYWTGGGGDLNWFTAANWNSAADGTGDAATALASGDSFTFGSAIDTATAINYDPSVDDFAIGTITFASGCGAVTVSGADVNKVTQIVNESGVVQTFANDVYFDSTLNVRTSASATTGDPKVLFTGEKGAFGTKFANHNYYRGKNTVDAWKLTETPTSSEIAPDAHVTVKGAMSLSRENNQTFNEYATTIRQGAKLTVLGLATLTGQTGTSGNYFPRLLNGNNGLVEFRGGLTINHTGSRNPAESKFDHYFDNNTGKVAVGGTLFFNASGRGNGNSNYQSHKCSIKANEIIMLPGLTIRNNGNYRVQLLYTEISKLKWSAAEGDVTFTGYYNSYHDGAKYKPFEFSTTDAYDGATPRKITVAGILDGNPNYQPTSIGFSASGCGTNAFTCAFNFNGGFTAKDTVTVSIDASGARPGSGAVTMQTGTTLAVGKSVTSGSLGNLTLQQGTSLAFNFTSTATAPVLALGGTLTLPSVGQDPVTVKVSANEGLVFDFNTEYAITSGGKFPADAVSSGTVVLTDDSPAWAILYVNDTGDLAVKVAEYFYIKIAGSSSSNLEVPLEWIYGNTATDEESSLSEVSTALSSPGANGIPVWQSYCLGLDPQDAQSVVLCEAAPDQPQEAGAFKFTTKFSLPESLSGVTVTASLERKSSGDWVRQGDFQTITHDTPVAFTANADPATALSFFA